ncbi:hypothetical protein ACFPK5_40035 [Streptomyces beijiangensis]|uniref:hypothetical protein n=1 Tax=Streptomyces beijiangensis TaxID=163361 RepID=UPI0036221CE7
MPDGIPILLDEAIRPVSSWFRSLALDRRDAKAMRSYAYSVLMLLHLLLPRGADLRTATEPDIPVRRPPGSHPFPAATYRG